MTSPDPCPVEGCTDNRYGRQRYCRGHDYRWRRYGHPEAHNVRTRLPRAELVYLRRLEGIPDDGPTEAQRQQWIADEQADQLMEAS